MNGSFNLYDKLLEGENHAGDEKGLNEQQVQNKYGYRVENKKERRHRSMVVNSMNPFSIDKIYKPLNRKRSRLNTCPELRKEVSGIEQVSDCSNWNRTQDLGVTKRYEVEEKKRNARNNNDDIIERFNEISEHMEQTNIEQSEEMEIITPMYMHQVASVNSLIQLHNVAKLITEEPIISRKNDYITDKIEEGGNELDGSRFVDEKFIKVVDFCKEEAERKREKEPHPLLPSNQQHTKVSRKSCIKDKASKLCNIDSTVREKKR